MHINFCVYDSTWEATEAFELDAVQLDVVRLHYVATIVAQAVRSDKHARRFLKDEVHEILAAAIRNRCLSIGGLKREALEGSGQEADLGGDPLRA